MNRVMTLNRQARGRILDYALGATIVILLPIPYSMLLKVVILPVLLGLMVKGLLRLWQGYKPDAVAKLSLLVSWAGAILLGWLGWLGGIALATRIPWLTGLAPGIAVFSLFWGVGQAVNHCYLSGEPTPKPHSPQPVKGNEA